MYRMVKLQILSQLQCSKFQDRRQEMSPSSFVLALTSAHFQSAPILKDNPDATGLKKSPTYRTSITSAFAINHHGINAERTVLRQEEDGYDLNS
jgi:hypothetical protein